MRWTADRDRVRQAFETVKPALSAYSMAALHCLRVEAADGRVKVEASSFDLTIDTSFAAAVAEEGVALIPASRLLAWLSKAPDETVEVSASDETVEVSAGGALMSTRTVDLSEWPQIRRPDGDTFDVDADTWAKIRRLIPFASTDQSRPTLCAIRFDGDGVWATDSYQAAHLAGHFDEATLPVAAVSAVDVGDTVQVTVDSRHAVLSCGETTWTCRLIEGQYPNVAGVFPSGDHEVEIDCDRAELADALKRALALDSAATTAARLDLSSDHLEVRIDVPDVASGVEHVDAGVTGSLPSVAFAPRRLLALLAADSSERVTLKGVDALKAWVSAGDDLVVLLMPMRVS